MIHPTRETRSPSETKNAFAGAMWLCNLLINSAYWGGEQVPRDGVQEMRESAEVKNVL